MTEEDWIAARSQLRQLHLEHPEYCLRPFATATNRSLGWVKKWLARLRQADPAILHSHSSIPHHRPPKVASLLVERVVALRTELQSELGRVPGPVTLQYYLAHDELLLKADLTKPPQASTLWRILTAQGCIAKPTTKSHRPVARPGPLCEFQYDFKDVTTVTVGVEGKKAHLVEVLNVVDVGTSTTVAAVPREDYNAVTVLDRVLEILQTTGLPKQVTFDRDPRVVSAASGRDFPSALLKFW